MDRWGWYNGGVDEFNFHIVPTGLPEWRMYGWQDIEEYQAADPSSELLVRGWTGRLPCTRLYSDAEHSSRQETGPDSGLGAFRIDALVQLGLGRLFARTEDKQFDLMCGERAWLPESTVM